MALTLEDPWERRRKIRSLGGRIAAITISVWDDGSLDPEDISEPMGCFYFLKNNFYIQGKGITLTENSSSYISNQF